MAFEREYPGSRHLASSLIRRLELVGGFVEASITEVARAHGLSHAALNALAVIEGAGRPVSAGDVGKVMHITSGSITSVIDTLVKRGLVQRFTDADDRRVVLLEITPEAEGLLDRLLPEVQERSTDLCDGITDRDIELLLGLLARVEANLPAPPTNPAPRKTPKRLRSPRDPDGRRRG